jgi:hypothetical protein
VAHGFSRACVNGVTRLLSSLLFGVALTHAAIFAGVAAVVLLVASWRALLVARFHRQ